VDSFRRLVPILSLGIPSLQASYMSATETYTVIIIQVSLESYRLIVYRIKPYGP